MQHPNGRGQYCAFMLILSPLNRVPLQCGEGHGCTGKRGQGVEACGQRTLPSQRNPEQDQTGMLLPRGTVEGGRDILVSEGPLCFVEATGVGSWES